MVDVLASGVVQADVPAQAVPLALMAPLPATTTHQEDLTTAGQRKINQIWEITQALVTVTITLAAIWCQVHQLESDVLNFAFIAIISTYYARTNHTKIGGVSAPYSGR